MTCPRCRWKQYYTCTNRKCRCWTWVPRGKKAQVHPPYDGLACQYCGFKAHMDYWGERELNEASRSGAAG